MERAKEKLPSEDTDTGKRAVIYSWWSRARANGIDVELFDKFMEANLAFVDARVSHDEKAIENTSLAIKPFERYAG